MKLVLKRLEKTKFSEGLVMPGQIEEKSEISARDAIFWQELSHFLNGDMLWSEIFSIDGSVKIDV